MVLGMGSECVRCGASGDKTPLFDAIAKEGVVHICEKCSFQEGIPVIRKPTRYQLSAAKTPYTVYERLSRMAGLNAETHKEKVTKENFDRGMTERGQEATLRQIIDKNYQKKFEQKKEQREDLVPNFHWVVLRARRLKKLTQEQVAKEIDEPVTAIMAIERGSVPEDRPALLNKLQNFFRVKLYRTSFIDLQDPFANSSLIVKENEIPKQEAELIVSHFKKDLPSELKLEDSSSKSLTIADLREMKKRDEEIRKREVSNREVKDNEVEEIIVLDEDIEEDK